MSQDDMTDELSFDKAFASKSEKHQDIANALAESKPKKSNNHKTAKTEKSSKKRRRHASDDDESDDDDDQDMDDDDEEEQRRKRKKEKAKKEKEKEKEKAKAEKAKTKSKNNDSDDEETSKSKKRHKDDKKHKNEQDQDSSIRDKWKETEDQNETDAKEPDQATQDHLAKLAAEATAKFMPKTSTVVVDATMATGNIAATNGTTMSDSVPAKDVKSVETAASTTTTTNTAAKTVTEALAIAKAAAASAELAESKNKQQQQQQQTVKMDPAVDQTSTVNATGTELVISGTTGKEIINAPLWTNPNKWLGDNPNYFRNIKLNDIGFTVYITEDGIMAGKPAMRIFRRGNPRFDLEVVSPFGKVVRSHFGKDGNFRDPKSQKYILDKKIPVDAKQTICYICAAYTDYNKDENGLDIDMRDYFIWLLALGAAFYKAVCEYDQLQTGIKDKIKRLLKTDDPAVIYNGMYENYNPPIYEVVEPPTGNTIVAGAATVNKAVTTVPAATGATGETKKAPRKIVDPKELTCKIPTCFVWKKGSVFTRFTAGKKNRKKPAKGIVISSNAYLDMMHDYGYLYNYIPLFEKFSKTQVPFEKAELRGGDLCSDSSKIRPYMNGKNPETNDTVFGMGQSLSYVRIWERGGFMTAEQKAIMHIPADAPIPGEHDGIIWEDTVCETFQVPQDSSAIAKAIEESKAIVRTTN